eukprot:CAMPEP_0195070864 /NCGR_PEP_ID=MMETSP0448-20130528/14813_1 /TAXON_ID=66468 /ORGANISM="Heterocapsa triquestra, Strain CCMP 448" /LENGTH=143 /DNA_ID=CAMNT_0040102625 /DNA_START=212 /DNA_END=643 /DNA_ORIENTATION=-
MRGCLCQSTVQKHIAGFEEPSRSPGGLSADLNTGCTCTGVGAVWLSAGFASCNILASSASLPPSSRPPAKRRRRATVSLAGSVDGQCSSRITALRSLTAVLVFAEISLVLTSLAKISLIFTSSPMAERRTLLQLHAARLGTRW